MMKEFEDIIKYYKRLNWGATPQKNLFLLKVPKKELINIEIDFEGIYTYIKKTKKIDHLIIKSYPIPFNIKDYIIQFNNIELKEERDVYAYLKSKFIDYINSNKSKELNWDEYHINLYYNKFWDSLILPDEYSELSKEMLRMKIEEVSPMKQPGEIINITNNFLSNKTQESLVRPFFKIDSSDEHEYYVGICYFSDWTSKYNKITFSKKSIIKINSSIYEGISLESTENSINFDEENTHCVNYPKWLSEMIKTFNWEYLKEEKSQIEFVNTQIKKELQPEIIAILKDFSILKPESEEREVEKEFLKISILEKYKQSLKKILSPEKYSKIYDNGMKIKAEDVLNHILSDNLWILGHYGEEVELNTALFTDNIWKPDIVAKNKDGRHFVYELKRPDTPVIHWDNNHKSYFLSSECTKAVAQIENQHQYLIEKYQISGELTFTKNDQLFVVIGSFENEISEGKIKRSEEKFHKSKEKAIKAKKKGIQLLRNKFKNINIIFYDELDDSRNIGNQENSITKKV